MAGRIEIFPTAFSFCEVCGKPIYVYGSATGKLVVGKKTPKFARFCDGCFRIVKARKNEERRTNGTG